MPVYLEYRPGQNGGSPYFGHGWNLALDACVLQCNEDLFLIQEPDGNCGFLKRSKKQPDLLESENGTHATIDGNRITVYTGMGQVMRYVNGHIIEEDFGNGRKWRFDRTNSTFTITENGSSLFSVIKNTGPDTPARVKIGSEEFTINLSRCPVIREIGGKNIIVREDSAISRISGPRGTLSYTYSVTPEINPEVIETDSNGKESKFFWEAATGKALRINDCKYTINRTTSSRYDSPMISENKRESVSTWANITSQGKEIIGQNGIETITERYVQGELEGRTRRILKKDSCGKILSESRFLYDDKENLIGINSIDEDLRFTNTGATLKQKDAR
jgi:hypothetical protein